MNCAKTEQVISIPKPTQESDFINHDHDEMIEYEKLRIYRNALTEIALERTVENPAQERADQIRIRRRGY